MNKTALLPYVDVLQQGNAGGSGRTLTDFLRVGILPPSDEFWVDWSVRGMQ